MRSVRTGMLVLALCSLLAACGRSAALPAAPAASTGGSASAASLPHRDVLYVSDVLDSRVDIYPLNTPDPAPIGELVLGIYSPTGLALDSGKNLYVADNETPLILIPKHQTNAVNVFAKGASSPFEEYVTDVHNPTDVVVGADGTIYVASFGDGYVTEFQPPSKTPSLHFQPPSGSAFSLALDANNNLYVACTISNAIYKFAPGSTQGTNLGLVLKGEPHGMVFDNAGDLLVADSVAPNQGSSVDVFPPGSSTPSKTIGGTFQPFMIALDAGNHHLYVADFGSGNHDGAVYEFAYPSGRMLTAYRKGAAQGAYGVATNPAAVP